LNLASLLGPLVSAALDARPKRHAKTLGFLTGGSRSFLNAGNLLTLGGLGWAAYESWRSQRPAQAAQGAVRVTPGTVVEGDLPPPLPSSSPRTPPPIPAAQLEVQRIVDLTLAAARCDGEFGEEEYGRIRATARELGAEDLVPQALGAPRPVAELVRGISDRKQREALYVYAFSIVRADEEVSAGERTWLAQLANHLGIDAASAARLEKETAYRIATPAARA